MNNTPLDGSNAFDFDHTLKFFGHTGSIQESIIIAPKGPLFVAGDALKGRFIRRHDLLSRHQHSREEILK